MGQLLQRKRMVFMSRQRMKDLLLRTSVVITTANWKFPRRSLFARLRQRNELTIIFPLSTNLVIAFSLLRFLNSLLSAEGSRQAALGLIVLGGVYMRKLAPARVSHWDDFFISYRVYMMTGSFHISLFNGTFHVDKIHVWFKIANITHARLPADRFHTEMGARFGFT